MKGLWILRHPMVGTRFLSCTGDAAADTSWCSEAICQVAIVTLADSDIVRLEAQGWSISYGTLDKAHNIADVRDFVAKCLADGN